MEINFAHSNIVVAIAHIAPHRRPQWTCPALLQSDRLGLIQPMRNHTPAVQPPLSDLLARCLAKTASTTALSMNACVPLCILRSASDRTSRCCPLPTGPPIVSRFCVFFRGRSMRSRTRKLPTGLGCAACSGISGRRGCGRMQPHVPHNVWPWHPLAQCG